MLTFYYTVDFDSLVHHGIKGQKWGTRRYQNTDGSWTEEGKIRRRIGNPSYVKKDGSLTDAGKVILRSARKKNPNVDESVRNQFGITSYQAKGGTIKKGEPLYRITSNKIDKTIDNRKYFSTNPAENNAWAQMFGDQYRRTKEPTYSMMYAPVKDIKVASNAQLGKEFYNKVLKKNIKNLNANSLADANYWYGFKNSVNKNNIRDTVFEDDDYNVKFNKSLMKTTKDRNETLGSVASSLIAIQCEQGRAAVNAILAAGYDAISDVNGTDVSYDPIILLNPDEKVQRISAKKIPNRRLSKGMSPDRWPLMRP